MKLTDKAIKGIEGKREVVLDLCLALGFSELWVTKLIPQNKDNGPLTTPKSLQVIREATGLSDDEILTEDSEVKETQDKKQIA